MKFVLGVDEAGRGPLAGPVSVGIVMVPEGFDVAKAFPGVNDSKQLSEKQRERIYALLEEYVRGFRKPPNGGLRNPRIKFCVRYARAETIDKRGISYAVRAAIARGVRELAPSPRGAKVLLDGLLRAPAEYEQETIIHGDALVPLISLASIVAKVRRDRLMKRLARDYPEYHFAIHKGYGTALHYEMLQKHGPCAIHRQSYLHLVEKVARM